MEDEHRGIRSVALEAISVICEIQLQKQDSSVNKFREVIKSIAVELIDRIIGDESGMFRKKGDLLFLVSQLVVHINEFEIRSSVLHLLIKAWRDPNSAIRKLSIRRVIDMGEQGVQEVLQSFKQPGKQFIKDATGEKKRLPDIMQEIIQLVNNEDYMDKDSLQDLLKWRLENQLSERAKKPLTGMSMKSRGESG